MLSFLKKKFNTASSYSPVSNALLKEYNKHRPDGAKDLICYVPFNSLTFSWQGNVYACTYNRNILVGEYPQDSIREIWFGEQLKKLQGYIAHNDLNYGCQHCKYFVEKKKFTGLKPQSFDKYADYKKQHYPRVMEFELSNKCNLECIMCNGNTSSAIRQNQDKLPPLPMPYDDIFVEQLKEFIPYLKEAKFFGGEPFLIHSYFQIWDVMMEINPSIQIFVITNGTVLTEKVKELLDKGSFEIAVSIDSIRKERYEHIRKNANYENVMQNLDYFNAYCKSRGKTMSLSFTTQRANWDELPEVIEFCNKKGMTFFNSFLTAPFELSLIFLPSEKLDAIYSYLSIFELPENNALEKYNKQVYQDYLNYLLHYKEKNRNGIEYSEPKDNYQAVISERMKTIAIKHTTRKELYNKIMTMDDSSSLAEKNEVVKRIETLLDRVNNRIVEEHILADSINTPLHIIMRDIRTKTNEELFDRIEKQYIQTHNIKHD